MSENKEKQLKLTDAFLDNLLGKDIFSDKINTLRNEEEELKKLVAGSELMALERTNSEGYINRVKEFLDDYDDNATELDYATKRKLARLLFQNIKIAPPVGGASVRKRISFSLYEPFNFLFQEASQEKKCLKNRRKKRIQQEKSISEFSVVQ